jgi:hypothetical protein
VIDASQVAKRANMVGIVTLAKTYARGPVFSLLMEVMGLWIQWDVLKLCFGSNFQMRSFYRLGIYVFLHFVVRLSVSVFVCVFVCVCRYLFQASSAGELQAWIEAIQQAIHICTPQERVDFKQVDFP